MRDLTMKDLLDLAEVDVPDAEMRVQKMYEWHFERVKATSQWILGASGALFISLLVAFLRAELQLLWWQTVLIVVGALATGAYGMYNLRQLRLMHHEFVAALKKYSEFKKMRAFLVRYREESTR